MLLSSACAHFPLPSTLGAASREPLRFWTSAVEGDAGKREALWREARQSRSGWDIAMLQSLPDSSHYDPDAAEKSLRAMLKRGLPEDEAMLARLRLIEMDNNRVCRDEVASLRARMSEIVNIETRIKNGN